MTKNKKTKPIENIGVVEPKEVSKNWQSFKVLKEFPTQCKFYHAGDIFKHYDKRVINFLKTNKII